MHTAVSCQLLRAEASPFSGEGLRDSLEVESNSLRLEWINWNLLCQLKKISDNQRNRVREMSFREASRFLIIRENSQKLRFK